MNADEGCEVNPIREGRHQGNGKETFPGGGPPLHCSRSRALGEPHSGERMLEEHRVEFPTKTFPHCLPSSRSLPPTKNFAATEKECE
jgi:hypothetical protein